MDSPRCSKRSSKGHIGILKGNLGQGILENHNQCTYRSENSTSPCEKRWDSSQESVRTRHRQLLRNPEWTNATGRKMGTPLHATRQTMGTWEFSKS